MTAGYDGVVWAVVFLLIVLVPMIGDAVALLRGKNDGRQHRASR